MEDFGYLKDEEKSSALQLLKKSFMLGATLFSISCFIYITITAYDYVYQDENSDIIVIKSPEGPIKVTDEDSQDDSDDDMEVNNNSIYDDLFGHKKESLVKDIPKIRFAPQPAFPPKKKYKKETKVKKEVKKEVKVIKEKPAEPAATKKKVKKEVKKSKKETKGKRQQILVFSDKKKESDKPSFGKNNSSTDLLTKGKVKKKSLKPRKKSSKTKVSTITKADTHSIRVQIAALTSRESAKNYWRKISQSNSKLFSKLKPFTETVDLGKRGTFYRLQIGNFYNQTEAEKFCSRYISQTHRSKADCIMVE